MGLLEAKQAGWRAAPVRGRYSSLYLALTHEARRAAGGVGIAERRDRAGVMLRLDWTGNPWNTLFVINTTDQNSNLPACGWALPLMEGCVGTVTHLAIFAARAQIATVASNHCCTVTLALAERVAARFERIAVLRSIVLSRGSTQLTISCVLGFQMGSCDIVAPIRTVRTWGR